MTTQIPFIKTEVDSTVHLPGENLETQGDPQDFANLLEVPPTIDLVESTSANSDSGLLAEFDNVDINTLLADLESSATISEATTSVELLSDGIDNDLDIGLLDELTQRTQLSRSQINSPAGLGTSSAQPQSPVQSAQTNNPNLLAPGQPILTGSITNQTGNVNEIVASLAGEDTSLTDTTLANEALTTELDSVSNPTTQTPTNENTGPATAPTTAVATASVNENRTDRLNPAATEISESNAESSDVASDVQLSSNADSQQQSSDFLRSNLQSNNLNRSQSPQNANSQGLEENAFENLLKEFNQQNVSQNTEVPVNNVSSISPAKLLQYQALDAPDFSFQSIGENVREVLSDSISSQTIDAIQNGVLKSDLQGTHSFEIEIHPVELGKLNIEVDVASDAIQARIVATENFSADLLSRNKAELLEALADFGYSETNVDISHQDSRNQHEEHEFDFSEPVPFDLSQSTDNPSSLVVRVGVDLVA